MENDEMVWKCSQCAIQGRGHVDKGIPCQDKVGIRHSKGTHVMCLSDGAGSAKLSHFGAECVVEYGLNLFVSSFEDVFEISDGDKAKTVILETVLEGIEAKAKELSCDIKDLAATFLAVAVHEDKYIIVHVGDGVIGYLSDGIIKVASSPSNGEFSNETFFVTSSNAATAMKIFKGHINNIEGFVIMSDGTEQSLYNKKNNSLGKAVVKLLKYNVMLNENAMANQLRQTFNDIIIQKTKDDCSIALMSRECDHIRSIERMSEQEKSEVYMLFSNDNSIRKRVRRYDEIIAILDGPKRCEEISKKIHLRPKHTRKRLEHLCNLGLINYKNGYFISNV